MDITNTNAPQRVAIVTGGSGGIGRVTAERLARDGMAVVVNYAGNKDRADDTVEAITKAGGTAMSAQGDVANEQAMADMFSAATQAYGGVDVVVNTAGLMILAPVVDFKLENLDRMHRTNIRGTLVVSQLAAQQVRRGGAIINFSTSVVELALPTYAAYSSSKGAVEALTPILAKELGSKDITVNAVAPGPTATPRCQDTIWGWSKLHFLPSVGVW